ncbi:MAG: hypothetical protein Q8N58_01950 [bacterium]|nr:hypothetical protein [bacterium]
MMSKWVDWYPTLGFVVIVICGLILLPMVITPTEEKARPIDPVFKTEVCTRLNKANPEQKAVANIEYQVGQGWYQGWYAVDFFTTLEGELYEVRAYPDKDRDPFIFDLKKDPSRPTWQERFAEVRKEAETGLKRGAEDLLQEKNVQ